MFPMNNNVIHIENLNFMAGNRYLLKKIDWDIKQHENWLLFGLNGCGKTTLLSVIAGYGNYTSGTVEVLDMAYSEDTTQQIRSKIGFVSSSFFTKYFKYETVLHVVLSGLTGTLGVNFKISNQDVIRAKNFLIELGVEDKANQPFQELSKGEQQKVLIARALVANPEILILDEPSTGLDLYARDKMLRFIKKIANEDITIIYVTHYLEEVVADFDQCLVLKEGEIYAKGKTEEILKDGLLQQLR